MVLSCYSLFLETLEKKGRRGDKMKLPKAATGRSVVGEKSEYGRRKNFALRVLLVFWMKVHHHKASMISPNLELCIVKSSTFSKLKKARKVFLAVGEQQNFLAAALFPSSEADVPFKIGWFTCLAPTTLQVTDALGTAARRWPT